MRAGGTEGRKKALREIGMRAERGSHRGRIRLERGKGSNKKKDVR